MSRILATVLSLLLMAGCAAAKREPAQNPEIPYGKKIRDWQERIRREGWSESAVRALLADCRSLVRYQVELKDHWSTSREFIESGMEGDCEDIALFLMATLKHLGYPHRVRVLVVKEFFSDHALLRVELPEGRWAVFETMPGGRLEVQSSRLRPVVEFDEVYVARF
jgi:hypothetical protein